MSARAARDGETLWMAPDFTFTGPVYGLESAAGNDNVYVLPFDSDLSSELRAISLS